MRGGDCRLGQLLDLALIGSMWRGTTDRIDVLIADDEVEIGAIVTEGIVARQTQIGTGLPPSVLRTDDSVSQRRDEPGACTNTSLWSHDGNPVAFADPACRGGRRADLDKRLGQ